MQVPAGQVHERTFGGERLGDRAADGTASAVNDRDLVVEQHTASRKLESPIVAGNNRLVHS